MEIQYSQNQFEDQEESTWKHRLLAFFSLILITLSSIFFSLLLFITINNDWAYANHYTSSILNFSLSTFSYQGLLFFLLFFVLAVPALYFSKIFKKTSLFQIFINLFLFSVLFGLILFYLSLPSKIDQVFDENTYYQRLKLNQSRIWQKPDFGLLSGEIITINNIDNFLLMGFDNKIWQIDSEDALVEDKEILNTGRKIKLIGYAQENNFIAKEIIAY